MNEALLKYNGVQICGTKPVRKEYQSCTRNRDDRVGVCGVRPFMRLYTLTASHSRHINHRPPFTKHEIVTTARSQARCSIAVKSIYKYNIWPAHQPAAHPPMNNFLLRSLHLPLTHSLFSILLFLRRSSFFHAPTTV